MHKGNPAISYDETDKDDMERAADMLLSLTQRGLLFEIDRYRGNFIIMLTGGC